MPPTPPFFFSRNTTSVTQKLNEIRRLRPIAAVSLGPIARRDLEGRCRERGLVVVVIESAASCDHTADDCDCCVADMLCAVCRL